MTQAARLNDPIGHSPSMNWLLKGVVAGAAIGLGAVAIVGTGGLAAAAIVGGLAAGGAGIGEMMSTMSWAPKEVCGVIKGPCSGNVFVNGIPAARAHVDVVDCHKHSPPYPPIATGSATVFINGQPAARVDDKVGCSAVITDGSHNVFIGGDTIQTDVLHPENLVPAGAHAALLVVGVGSAVVLGGPIVAAAGLVGGVAGQFGGEWLGGKVFGVGSDGQKWAMLGGTLVGGMAGVRGGAWIAGKLPLPSTSTASQFIKETLPGTSTNSSFSRLSQAGGLKATEGRQVVKANGKLSNPTHPLEKHGPDVTDQYVYDRVMNELTNKGRTGLRTAFNDRAQMENAIAETLMQKKAEIDSWIASGPRAGVPKPFEGNPGMGNLGRGFEVTHLGGPIIPIVRPMPNVNLVLIPDGKNSYLIHTAHPF